MAGEHILFIHLYSPPTIEYRHYVHAAIRYPKLRRSTAYTVGRHFPEGGSLRKAEEGKIKISFRVDLETDYEGRWNNLPHLFLFRWFYDMFIGKRYILSYIELSKKDYEELRAEIKVLLGIENYLKKF